MQARRGQSLVEYALLMGLVIAAFTAMRLYVERGLKAELRKDADDLLSFSTVDTRFANLADPSETTQAFGFTTGTGEADFTTTDDAQHTVQRSASGGGQVTQAVTSAGQTVRFGSQSFTQLEGPPVENQK